MNALLVDNVHSECEIGVHVLQFATGHAEAGKANGEAAATQSCGRLAKNLEPELLVVDGLTFRPGESVRMELQIAENATEEGHFAKLVSAFLSKAHAGRKKINEEAEKVQVSSPKPGSAIEEWSRLHLSGVCCNSYLQSALRMCSTNTSSMGRQQRRMGWCI